jgi:hypothetical protein
MASAPFIVDFTVSVKAVIPFVMEDFGVVSTVS